MASDLNAMSRKELLKLRDDVDKALKRAEAREKAEALRAAERAAAEYGFSLGELAGAAKSGSGRKPSLSPPKYRNPDNPEQTWTGRGRKPQWVHDAPKRGADITELEI